MTRLEIMKQNQKKYAEYQEQIKKMTGLEKAVAENIILEWIKGNKWMSGISDSLYQRKSDKLVAEGYDEMDIYNEVDKQIERLTY